MITYQVMTETDPCNKGKFRVLLFRPGWSPWVVAEDVSAVKLPLVMEVALRALELGAMSVREEHELVKPKFEEVKR